MDQVKRAASRLRRLQRALAPTISIEAHRAYLQAPFSVRPFLNRPWVLSLRKTIDDTVVAFVPPNMPLSDSRITCSDALVEYRSSGHWTLNARIEALGRAPVVFVIGFMTNQRGYFGGLIGAVNFAGTRAFAVSPTNTVTISAPGFSKWIQKTYGAAVAEGLTIRIHSSVNLQAPIRSLAQQWAGQFGRRLYRPMSLLDLDDDDRDAWGVKFMEGGSTIDEASQDRGGLSFGTSLLFE